MPRTKLDRFRQTREEREAWIIRGAMARNRMCHNYELAEVIQSTPAYVSKCFKNGFSDKMKARMHKKLRFTAEEWEELVS